MISDFVAIDLETTGLIPDKDRITEIGAVRFQNGLAVDHFSELIDPGCPISAKITAITGITNAMVAGKPTPNDLLPQFWQFCAGLPLVAHNISFDLNFLSNATKACPTAELPPTASQGYDTLELARMVLPGCPNFTLEYLITLWGIDNRGTHRAHHDAQMCGELMLKLQDYLLFYPASKLQRIADIMTLFKSPWLEIFTMAAQARASNAAPTLNQTKLHFDDRTFFEQKADSTAVTCWDPNSPVSRSIGSQNAVSYQQNVADHLTQTLQKNPISLLEYRTSGHPEYALISAAFKLATKNPGTKVALLDDNNPAAMESFRTRLRNVSLTASSTSYFFWVNFENYICLSKWNKVFATPETYILARELPTLISCALWIETTKSGDVGSMGAFRHYQHSNLWDKLCCDPDSCLASRCTQAHDCFGNQANRNLEQASVIIYTNQTPPEELQNAPQLDFLIANNICDYAATVNQKLGYSLTRWSVLKLLNLLYYREQDRDIGIFSALPSGLRSTQNMLPNLIEDLQRFRQQTESFFGTNNKQLAGFFNYPRKRICSTAELLRVIDLPGYLNKLAHINARLVALVDNLEADGAEKEDISEIESILRKLWRLEKMISTILNTDFFEGKLGVLELSRKPRRRPEWHLQAQSLMWAPELNKLLYQTPQAVALASPYLRIKNRFDYCSWQLGLTDTPRKDIAVSCFKPNPKTALASTVEVWDQLPETNDPSYLDELFNTYTTFFTEHPGRHLLLFPTYSQMQNFYRNLQPFAEKNGFPLLGQGIDGASNTLVRLFEASDQAILIGTDLFWSESNIAPGLLDTLLFGRLPFAAPIEPYNQALSALLEEKKQNVFRNLLLPQAVMRLNKACSMVKNTETHATKIIITDKRAHTKSYGEFFLESL